MSTGDENYTPDPDDLHAVVNYDEDMEEFDFTNPIVCEPGEDVIAAVERFLHPSQPARDYSVESPITRGQWLLSKMLWLMAGGCWVIAIGSIIYWWQP